MTESDLAGFDGRDGRSAYVAVGGTIYDVTASPLWKGGDHQGAHQAGSDLTEALKGAPHVRAVVERFPVVGRLEADPPPPAAKGGKGLFIGIIIAVIVVLAIILSR